MSLFFYFSIFLFQSALPEYFTRVLYQSTFLCYDVFRVISLHLEAKKLIVCKELLNMYDDNWYHDTLQLKYPSLKLYTTTNYQDLYNKSIQEGTIYYINTDLTVIQTSSIGIKASYNTLILRFNGDLYYDSKLIDTYVIDICDNGYIKLDSCYIKSNDEFVKLNIKPKIS